MGIKKKQDEKLVIHKPPHGGKIEFEQPYDFNIIKIGQTSEPPMTLRELNKKVDKIETTVSELAKIVTEFIVRQE
ncbi:MAG: hypothetical protein LBQ45_01750, partial [Mycoplasmataceae bacterium]|nr:hypothetical protein [Mycoplasmataceae bacterium]